MESEPPVDPRWYDGFFDASWLAVAQAIPSEQTAAEVDFVVDALALEAGASVVDVACGHGRHAIELARRGFAVTGVDLSAPSLVLARDAATAAGVEVELLRGDMRDLPFDARFDAALNMFSAFGYLESEHEDGRMLDAVARALRPGGRLLLDTRPIEPLLGAFREQGWNELEDGTLVLERRAYDAGSGRVRSEWLFVAPDGARERRRSSIRMYTLPELRRLLDASGLRLERAFGGFDGGAFGLDSRRLIAVAVRD